MGRSVHVIGVGMTPFTRPSPEAPDYPDLARRAGVEALNDAGVEFSAIEQAVCGYVYGDSTCGQRAVYELGTTGIPVFNVNNNCATGSSALLLAWQMIRGGVAECVLALGFERMQKGSLSLGDSNRTHPLDRHIGTLIAQRGMAQTPPAAQFFGNAGLEHMEKYGSTPEQFAQVAVKNHAHSVHNPRAQYREVYSLEQVMASSPVHGALTKLQCCPTSDGAAAAVLASEDFMRGQGIEGHGVQLRGMAMATDLESSFGTSAISLVGADMAALAASRCFAQTGLSPDDVDVIELHDCFSANELLSYEALGLCEPGLGGRLVEEGQVTYGGRWVVNPSGGLISKGHPLGATGLAQCAELSWQLRGTCGKRQVAGAEVALQHNLGLGGACVVAAYVKG